ncbi:MAG: PD40 domain-containing protein [Planctomycetes bacterium]|nr:PD40 domain-containing protein [Planctomycetota bacterium]
MAFVQGRALCEREAPERAEHRRLGGRPQPLGGRLDPVLRSRPDTQGRLWVARRESRWDEEGNPVPFGDPEPVDEVNNTVQDGSPEISADGLELFLASRRPGGAGDVDIWVARRERDDPSVPFEEPVPVEGLVNTPYQETHPSISSDGKWLFFSDTPGRDLLTARQGTWASPTCGWRCGRPPAGSSGSRSPSRPP